MAIRTLIVDDEKKAREGLMKLLEADHELVIAGLCSDGAQAIEILKKEPCDLLLLDIQMPAINGFDVLRSVDNPPHVIFITAFDDYALKAFEFSAIDYLLKPFTNERFYDAIQRAKGLIRNKKAQNLSELIKFIQRDSLENELIHTNEKRKNKLVIRSSGKIILVAIHDLIWVEGYDYYIKIHALTETYIVRESMKSILNRLPSPPFLRVHKSAIINSEKILHLENIQNSEYMMSLEGGHEVKVSRSFKKSLDQYLEGL